MQHLRQNWARHLLSNMAGLNPKQEEACSYTEGPLLILAGAGSGKTRVITHRIAYLISEKEVNPYNILAITFTNKAAGEMRERVDSIVGFGAESIWVSTFHSMCVRILRRFYDRLGGKNSFTIYDADDQKAAVKEVLRLLSFDEKQYPIRAMIAAISKAKESFLSPDEYDRQAAGNYRDQNIAKIYREYQKRLRSNNALDFDDLICRTIDLFMQHPDVLELYQERFRYIMVDEYQDTNHAQFVLVKMLAAKYRNLCVVGDDDQSIYKFRGANIYNILNFEEEYPDAKVVKLEQNYRSTSNILNAANGVIANNEGRKDKSLWTENPEGEKVLFTRYEDDRGEAVGVCKRIFELMKEGRGLSEMAVLYRTNAQSRVLEEQMIREDIPYQLVGGTNFYARKEIRDMVGYLKCIANPADDISLSRIINVPRRGIGDTTVTKMRDFAAEQGMSLYDVVVDAGVVPGLGRAASKLEAFAELMQGFRRVAEDGALSVLYADILQKTGYREELEKENTDEARSRLENLRELSNKISDYELHAEQPSLTELLEEISLVADTEEREDGSERITMMTLHSAKGLEFPYVFMVGMEERLFPSGMSLDSDDPDAEEEERRLCYVGITRAKEQLFLSAASRRMVNGNITYPEVSRFIGEIPENLIRMEGKKDSNRGYSGERYYDEWQGSTFRPKPSGAGRKSYLRTQAGGSLQKGMPQQTIIDYTVGDTVKHIKFGRGVVTEMTKGGSDYEVTVRFDTAGEKRMFASLAKLRKV